MAKRIIKKIPFEDETIVFETPDGKKHTIECTEGSYTEESVELDAAEAVILDQMVKDRLQEAQQQQDTQEVQSATGGNPITDDQKPKEQGNRAVEESLAALDSFFKQPEIAEAVAQQEELQQLMRLPLSQIEALPHEKRELVWQELGRQIVEMPGFVECINAIADMGKCATAAMQGWKPLLQQMAEAANKTISGISAAMESIRKGVANLLSADDLAALHTWATLAPYIEEEADAHPEKYGEQATEPASANELIAAAARRARADGKDIPPLKAEEEPEQLQTQLDLIAATALRTPEDGKEDTPAALIEKIKKMPVLNPQAHIMPNNALMNAMQYSDAFNAGELALPVIPAKGRQKEISAYTIINYNPDETSTGNTGVTITDPKLTEYERNVSNAIISLWFEAEKLNVEPVFTTDTIYRAMPGGGEAASPQQKSAITKAFEKFRRIHMTIDATDELRKRGAIKSSETFKLDDYYFNVRRAKRTSKHSGQSVIAYQMIGKPVILQYAEMTGQILSVPAKHLTIRKIDKSGRISTELVTMNADRQAITGYMMRRIAVMKHDLDAARDRLKSYERKRKQNPGQELPQKPLAAFRQQSNTILFESLFAQVGISTTDRKQLMLYRNFCYEVLEYWKATGFIKGYAEQSKGRKIIGISIEL